MQGSDNVARAAPPAQLLASTGGQESAARIRRARPTAQAQMRETLGRALKAHYTELVSAPLPDKLVALLAELEAKEMRREP